MKTILLQFKDARNFEPKPRRFVVEYETERGLVVSLTHKHSDKSVSRQEYTLTRQADGSFRNQHGCEYVQVKADRRPKPFSVVSHEEGRGPGHTEKFATIEELKAYVLGRWQGWDYYDGGNSFHGDYATFTVNGAELASLVPPREDFGSLDNVLAKFKARQDKAREDNEREQ